MPARLILFILGGLLIAPAAVSQHIPVSWAASAEPASVAAGDLVTVTIRGEIEPGWRVYAMDSQAGRPLRVSVEPPPGVRALGAPQQAQPNEGYDQWFESDYTYFTDRVTVTQAFRVGDQARGDQVRFDGTVTFMVCNDEVCLPARNQEIAAPVRLTGAVVTADASESARSTSPTIREEASSTRGDEPETAARDVVDPDSEAADPSDAVWGDEDLADASTFRVAPAEPADSLGGSTGMFAFILLAIGAGLAALLSPCVFPMIPLTVSFFVHQGGDRRRTARMAAVYGVSIVGIFTGLGLAMALLVGAAGPMMIASNPWVNLFLGSILLFFGFSMLGFFELRLPSKWLSYVNRQGDERGGYLGVVFMGLTLTLVSFSCTVPFVGALLAQAVSAEWTYPIVGMIVFSTVFALPFVGFALFPRALQRMPRSGSWMIALKGFLGFLVIAAALTFISNADLVWGFGLLSRPLAIALMVVIFTLAGFFLLNRLALRSVEPDIDGPRTPEPVGPIRLIGAIGSFGVALYMLPGLFGSPLGGLDAFLPPQRATDVGMTIGWGGERAAAATVWLEDRGTAFERAEQKGRPVLVDFTGYTCTNCRYMEANVLATGAVSELIREGFVPLKLWTDNLRNGQELQRYQFELTGRITLPTYAIVSSDGQLIDQLAGVATVEEFASFLERNMTVVGDQLAGS